MGDNNYNMRETQHGNVFTDFVLIYHFQCAAWQKFIYIKMYVAISRTSDL